MKRGQPYPFDRGSLLLGHANLLSSRRQWRVAVCLLTEQLQKLLRVLPDQLRQLRVARADLLKDRFEHVGLCLDDRAQLLELGVVTKEIKITQPSRSGSGSSSSSPRPTSSFSKKSCGCRGCLARGPTSTAGGSVCLSRRFKEVDRLVACVGRGIGRSRCVSGPRPGPCRGSSCACGPVLSPPRPTT